MSKIPLGLEGIVIDHDDDLAAAPGLHTGGQPLKTREGYERARPFAMTFSWPRLTWPAWDARQAAEDVRHLDRRP
jgi:hypothetical protein